MDITLQVYAPWYIILRVQDELGRSEIGGLKQMADKGMDQKSHTVIHRVNVVDDESVSLDKHHLIEFQGLKRLP